MDDKFNLRQFKRKYGTHDQCLEAIKKLRYPDNSKCPKCKHLSVFYRVSNRTAYACKFCGHHVYPLTNTIFEKSTTPLHLWFLVLYLMTQTYSNISVKQLEKILKVTYKTAWRMHKQTKLIMMQNPTLLNTVFEMDEIYSDDKKDRKKGWGVKLIINNQLWEW